MLQDIPIGALFGILLLLIIVSAFFSGSETGLISLNRYRLRHLSKEGHKGANRAQQLLASPNKLFGIILLGNNFVNILASSLATIIALRLWGEGAILAATLALTFVVLIFAEITPKTMAAIYPERLAFPATLFLNPLLKLLNPLVWLINTIPNGLFRLLGVSQEDMSNHSISAEELKTVVAEAGAMLPHRHQKMLLSVLELEDATVEDIMIPRNEIIGINLDNDWDTIVKQLMTSQHTRLPVYRGEVDNMQGIIHLRNFLALYRHREVTKEDLKTIMRDAYYIPEATPLNKQLLHFQQQRRRIGLVVDEYGDIQGLVTLDDILEEIVGEFTTDPANSSREIHPQEDGTYLVDATITIRELNRALKWELPTSGARTLNGLVTEYLETIPEAGTSFMLAGYPMEIVQTANNVVKTLRIDPAFRKNSEEI